MSEETTLLNTEQLVQTEYSDFNKIIKRIISLSLPMAGIQLISVASSFLCMIMLAQLGHQVLAASALIYATQTSVMVIGMSILLSLSILVGHAYGAKNYSAIGHFLQQGWTLGLILSLPIMLFYWHIGTILIHCGQNAAVTQVVQTFFHAYIWSVIPLQLLACNQQFCYGVRKQIIAILSSCVGVVVLLISAYTLIYGKFGLPQLGVAGLGYAMAGQAWCGLIFSLFCFCFLKGFKQFDLFNYRVHKDWSYLKKMFKVGWPISTQISGEMLSFFVNASMVGWLGVTALSAYQVTVQCLFVVLIPMFSLAGASGILVGQACGSKNFHEIKRLGYASMGVTLAISIFVALVFLLFPQRLASLYLDVHNPANADTVHLIMSLFAITAFSLIVDGIRNVLTGSLRGLLDTKYPMFVGLSLLWLVGIPLSYLFAFHLHFGVIGIAMGSAVSMTIGTIILLRRWHNMCKKFA